MQPCSVRSDEGAWGRVLSVFEGLAGCAWWQGFAARDDFQNFGVEVGGTYYEAVVFVSCFPVDVEGHYVRVNELDWCDGVYSIVVSQDDEVIRGRKFRQRVSGYYEC